MLKNLLQFTLVFKPYSYLSNMKFRKSDHHYTIKRLLIFFINFYIHSSKRTEHINKPPPKVNSQFFSIKF